MAKRKLKLLRLEQHALGLTRWSKLRLMALQTIDFSGPLSSQVSSDTTTVQSTMCTAVTWHTSTT
jgi:hypothetical protein